MLFVDQIPYWIPILISLILCIATVLQTVDQLRVRLYATFNTLYCNRNYGTVKYIWTTWNLSDIDPNWKSISNVSKEYYSAFTPAPYTFAIWGLIYGLQILSLTWALIDSFLLNPQQPIWLHRVCYILPIMYIFEIVWLYTFTWEYLWISEIAIVLMTTALSLCYRYAFPGYKFTNPGHMKTDATIALEFVFWIMLSVSLGWNLVATFAGFFTTGILKSREESVMFVVIGAVLPALSFAFTFRHGDFVLPIVFLWAALGIAWKKKTPVWASNIAYTGIGNIVILTVVGSIGYQLT